MSDLLQSEGPVRLIAFVGAMLLLVALQWRFALRGDGRLARRQAVNLSMGAIDTLMLRFAFPILAVAWAAEIQARDGGLLGTLPWPAWLEFTIAVLILDLVIYWQHRLMHAIPLLWRMHRVHHADRGFDVTTAVRFHPLEIALSMALKLGVIAVLGPSVLAVLTFELMLSLGSLWTHTDIALPDRLDRAARWLVVTPSMHRIHHSTRRVETDSNFGFHLTLWDRLFGSYRDRASRRQRDMPIGLERFRADRDQTLLSLLLNPFRSRSNEEPDRPPD